MNCKVNGGLLTNTTGPRFAAKESCTNDGTWIIQDMHQGERTVIRVAPGKVAATLAHVQSIYA